MCAGSIGLLSRLQGEYIPLRWAVKEVNDSGSSVTAQGRPAGMAAAGRHGGSLQAREEKLAWLGQGQRDF